MKDLRQVHELACRCRQSLRQNRFRMVLVSDCMVLASKLETEGAAFSRPCMGSGNMGSVQSWHVALRLDFISKHLWT